jgi:hypothetical protein
LKLETQADFDSVLARLRRRDPESMAAFILSLVQDSGPVGEQVRTFIVGDDVAQAAESLRRRIRRLESPSEYNHRHALGEGIGQSLQFILDGILCRRETTNEFAGSAAAVGADKSKSMCKALQQLAVIHISQLDFSHPLEVFY